MHASFTAPVRGFVGLSLGMRSKKREEPLGSEWEMSDTQMLRRATLYEALKDSGERARLSGRSGGPQKIAPLHSHHAVR